MHEVGSAALVDTLLLDKFYAYAHETVNVEIHQMAQELRLKDFNDLKRFESYLAAVAVSRDSALDLPCEYASIKSIEQRAPELIGKRYKLYVSKILRKNLQDRTIID